MMILDLVSSKKTLLIIRNVILSGNDEAITSMANPFDGLNDAFGTEPTELQKHVEKVKPTLKKSDTEDVKQDYETTRAQLHNLVMKGQRRQ